MEEMAERQYGERERFQRDPVTPTANTVYLRVKSEQVKGILGSKYAVPQGFVGLCKDKEGQSRLMLPGEEATGDFTIHLVRDRDVRIPFNMLRAKSRDGFDAAVSFELSVRPDVSRHESIEAFIGHSVEGRRHLDWPLLKGEIQPFVAAAVKKALLAHDAQELAGPDAFELLRDEIVERCADDLANHGIGPATLELGRVKSSGFEKHRHALAKVEHKREKAKAEHEVQAAILRDQLGQELSRQELEEFLDSAREEGLIKKQERKRAELERKRELDQLEAEYREHKLSLEASLRALLTKEKLELDSIKLDRHLGIVKKLRDELDDDRLEVYINLITDERLKADLLHRMIQKSMTPEQLKAIAEIESQKARASEVVVSRPTLEPIRETPSPEPPAESDSVRIGAPEEATITRKVQTEDAASHAAAEMNEALGSALTEGIEEIARPKPDEEETEETPVEELVARVREKESLDGSTDTEYVDSMHLEEVPDIDALCLVASGRSVYAVDPLRQKSLENAALTISFEEGGLGSLRSARVFGEDRERVVIAGARNGVYTTLLAHRKGAREFPIGPGVDARTGVNSTVLYRGFIYATHSEFGLLRWPYLQPYSSAMQVMPELISQYNTTRALRLFDKRLLFANGPTVLLLEATSDTGGTLRVAARYRGTRHEVTALAEDGQFILIADAAGDVYVWDPKSDEVPVLAFYAGSAISDLSATELKDGRKCLLVAIKRPVLPMLFRDGTTALEYKAPEPVRGCEVLNQTVVGLSRDRMRIFAWLENRPDWPQWQFQFSEPVLDMRLVPPGRVLTRKRSGKDDKDSKGGLKRPPGH